MKIFQNKSIFKKLIIVLLVIMLFSFCMPKTVRAEDGIGGKLLNPIMSFFVSLGDGAMTLLHKVVYNSDTTLVNIDSSSSILSKVIVIVAAVLIAAVAIVAVILTAGGAVVVALGVIKVVLVVGAITTITYPVTTSLVEGMLPESFYLPLYVITPQEIFSNEIPLFDVDFFNPMEATETETSKVISKDEYTFNLFQTIGSIFDATKIKEELLSGIEGIPETGIEWEDDSWLTSWDSLSSSRTLVGRWEDNGNKYKINIAFSNGSNVLTQPLKCEVTITQENYKEVTVSTAQQLQSTVSNWYIILRDISLVALLSVLVYIGIKILISSTSNDKAKYKQMLMDWVVAICLLFVMQYIMAFSNLLVGKFIDVINTTKIDVNKDVEIIEPEMYDISDSKIVKKAYETLVSKPAENGDIASEEESPYYAFFVDNNGNTAGSSSTRLLWPAENFVQQARINLQLLSDNEETYVAIGWKLIYVVLVVLTFIFIFTYLKRVVYMAFLTLIAPLVALTYPIDKINDGKAQAFNMWFKEYIFNLLIQPMHLILYTILIGSAMEFASKNILYVVVALGFMVPAEKLLRSFFGFEKAKTPGLLAGPAGAALMMSGMNKLFGIGPKGGKASGGKNSGGKEIAEGKDKKIKFKDSSGLLDDNINVSEQHNAKRNIGGEKDLKNVDNILESQKPQYIEDIISNWAGDKKYAAAQKMNNISDSINNNKVVKGIKNIGNNTIGRPIRAIKKLPQHSRFVNAGVRGIKKSTNTLANKLGNSIKEYNPAKTAWNIAKVGAKAAVGGTTGLVAGSIAGMASGDPSKAAQYTVAGAIGGYKLADSVDKKIADDVFANTGFKEAATKGYYGDDYDQHMIDKKVKEIQNDYDNKQKVMDKFNGDKDLAKKFMNDTVPEYAQYGITDMNDIMAAYKLEESGIDRKKAIYVASSVNDYGKNTSKLGAKDSDDLNKTIENRARKNKNLKNQEDIVKVTKDTRDLMDRYSAIKFSK